MVSISKLAAYYKKCLYEEAKVSAFSNLNNEDNTVVILSDKEDNSADLTSLNMRAQLDKNKQLLYGYMFLKGNLLDGTEIYTPLFYADCTLEREGGKMIVIPNKDMVAINLPALIQLVPNNDDKDMLIQQLVNVELTLPMEDETIDNILGILKDTVNILDTLVYVENTKAVILTTINKGLAGVINELSTIANSSDAFLGNTSLNDCEPLAPVIPLDFSQAEVLKRACSDNLTAIAGPPGTGKSHVIAAIACNYILNGKSVLICSKQNSAVDVIYNKLRSICDAPFCVRTGGKEYRNSIATQVDEILSKTHRPNLVNDLDKRIEEFFYEMNIVNKVEALNELGSEFAAECRKCNKELAMETNWFKRIGLKFKKLNADTKLDDLLKYIDNIREQSRNDTSISSQAKIAFCDTVRKKLIEAKDNAIVRRTLLTFAKSLKKGGIEQLGETSKGLFELLVDQVFPCWCTTAVDVSTSIPLIRGMFDLVIIDEASQCDIATCLPLLYRAKAAVIVGDDKQLKYISFIPTAINNANMKSSGLTPEDILTCNYRECSMFDYATFMSDNGSIMLTKQYRGNSNIMDFSNQKFYHGCIENVGEDNWDTLGPDYRPVRVVYRLDGSVEKSKTINKAEIEAVLEFIEDIIEKNDGRSIGVLSPFKDQVRAIEKAVYEKFTIDEINEHNILIGTAHSFQGEERDVMILSWVVSHNSPIQQHTFINNPNLFNVAITRANKNIINIVSTEKDLRGLLKEYIEYCDKIDIVNKNVNTLDKQI